MTSTSTSSDLELKDLKTTGSLNSIVSYGTILRENGLGFRDTGFHLQVGEAVSEEGWVLNISVILKDVPRLLHAILPTLKGASVSFKIVKNSQVGECILNGDIGREYIGKVVTIQPASTQEAVTLAKLLVHQTEGLKGPKIVTDIYVGGTVYTCYNSASRSALKGEMEKSPTSKGQPNWPFGEISVPMPETKIKILNNKYFVASTIKEDPKGNVYSGVWMEKWYKISSCIIKEGKYGMVSDIYGRDICDKIRWQYEVFKRLLGVLRVPIAYDLIEEGRDVYMILEKIKGRDLDKVVIEIFKGKTWDQLGSTEKDKIFDFAIQIILLIDKIHENGYIHRDLTPMNLMVDTNQNIWIIDLEQAYWYKSTQPYPAFNGGTFGFSAPEHWSNSCPTPEEDIYSFGCLLLFLFTSLAPGKFSVDRADILEDQLSFFLENKFLIKIIVSCCENDPSLRPTAAKVYLAIANAKKKEKSSNHPVVRNLKRVDVEKVIDFAIGGLASERMQMNQLWVSQAINRASGMKSEKGPITTESFDNGLPGVIFVLSIARKTGFRIDPCRVTYEKSVANLNAHLKTNFDHLPNGLYKGKAGIALALSRVLEINENYNIDKIVDFSSCFHPVALELSMSAGIAGQGTALLKIDAGIDIDFRQTILNKYIETLLSTQKKDGSWTTGKVGKMEVTQTGFSSGVGGIICFLLGYFDRYRKEDVRNSAQKALHWMIAQGKKNKGRWYWYINDREKRTTLDMYDGVVGIALTFIKAYQIFNEIKYKKMAEDILSHLPVPSIHGDLTLGYGLMGLAELYLEGAKVFNNPEWEKRVDWIIAFLAHHYKLESTDSWYWMPTNDPFPDPGLMTGNSGILHFLLRLNDPKIVHPVLTF